MIVEHEDDDDDDEVLSCTCVGAKVSDDCSIAGRAAEVRWGYEKLMVANGGNRKIGVWFAR